MKLKRNDIILLGIFLIGIILSFAAYHFLHRENGDIVQIKIDSKVVKTLPLDTNTTYTIQTSDGGENILKIQDGSAYIEEANCPDKLCVHQKKITMQGESLICLPHKVVVSIISSSKSKKATLDGVAQ